jgi:hypothetical protein
MCLQCMKGSILAEVARDQKNVKSCYTRLEHMANKEKNAFTQPHKPDLMIMLNEDILLENVCLELVDNRGCLHLNKTDFSKVITLMVVVFISSGFSLFFLLSPIKTIKTTSISLLENKKL